ncbi:hypothetical protein CPC16_009917 [Podila verticillata]|nr:hypothetical protein CPC16_009917 [Podila verticillata]
MEEAHATESLIVNISSPSHAPHRFAVKVSRQTTIHELKELIVTRLDTKPAVVSAADQRLIFGGRILNDKDTLNHIFDKVEDNDAPTIHLMVSHKFIPSAPVSPEVRLRRTSSTSTPTAPSSTPSAATTTSTTGATSGTNLNAQNSFSAMPSESQHYYDPNTTHSNMYMPMSPLHQPYQYVLVNGMPYLMPASLSLLHLQHIHMHNHGTFVTAQDGAPLYHIPTYMDPAQHQANIAAAIAAAVNTNRPIDVVPPLNAQEIAARDQRRAASLWLIMKLAFAVYLFSQNGSLERVVLLHIAALIIFLHQTGRLRIVRRIVPQPGQAPDGAPGANLNNNNAFINAGPQDTPGDTQPTTTSTTTTNTTMASSSSGPSEGSSSSEASTLDHSSSGTSHQETDTLTREASSSSSSNPSPLDNQQQDQPLPARVSPWRNIEHALLTFVTSLVPAPPPEIDPAVAAAAAGERM